MDKAIFANGDQYDCPFFAELPSISIAYVAVSGISFAEAAALFADAQKTSSIQYAGSEITGYTHLDYIMNERYGIKAQLRREG